MIVHEQDIVTIHWNDHYHVAIWSGFRTGEPFRAAMNQCLVAAEARPSIGWLADVKHYGATAKDDRAWIEASWFPRLIALGIRCFAVVVPEGAIAQIALKLVMTTIDEGDALATHYFDSRSEAVAWLDAMVGDASRASSAL